MGRVDNFLESFYTFNSMYRDIRGVIIGPR